MPLHQVPRSVYEAIRAQAREEVYDAIYREGAYLTNDEKLLKWIDPLDPASAGVELIDDVLTTT